MRTIHPVRYQLRGTYNCCCNDGCEAQHYAGRYMFVVFDVGRDQECTWWLSNN